MKRVLAFFIVFFILSPSFAFAGYEEARKIVTTEVVDEVNNFILVTMDRDKYLIHHKTGCGNVQEGTELVLVIRGDIDGNKETLWNGQYKSCVVDQAEQIDSTLTVTSISGSPRYASVSDAGKPFRIYYSERCKSIKNMRGKEIYVRKFGGRQLQPGDKIFTPEGGESCSITYVQEEGIQPTKKKPQAGDHTRPTTPAHVRAFPRKDAVYLYWKAATDNVAVAHYTISISKYHFEDEVAQDPSVKPQPMPQNIHTPDNRPHYKITGLDPDEQYYFRLIAVDTSGNESSYWSEEASSHTKSSIAEVDLKNKQLTVKLEQETDDFFRFGWKSIPGAGYTVILEVDGKREIIRHDWNKTYYKIPKKTTWKDKKLKLIVRSLNYRGSYQEGLFPFEF